MLRINFISTILMILSLQSKAQSEIILTNESTKIESVSFQIFKIDLSAIQNDSIGYYQMGKKNSSVKAIVFQDFEKDILKFLNNNFKQTNHGLPISMKVTHLKVHPYNQNKLSAEDTLLFECSFFSHWEGKEEHLFDYHGKNLFGKSDDRLLVFEKYLSRVILSSVSTFNTAFKKNPDWDRINQKVPSPIQKIIKHNSFDNKDSIACEKGFQLKKEYFTLKKNDSSVMNRSCRFVFTYQVIHEESKNGIILNIHTMSFFDRQRSFLNPDVNHDLWIQYQQGHADLCTIFGARLKKQFSEYPFTIGNFRTELNQIYNSLYDEYVKLRKQYKEETLEGNNTDKMNQWRIQFDQWINEL